MKSVHMSPKNGKKNYINKRVFWLSNKFLKQCSPLFLRRPSRIQWTNTFTALPKTEYLSIFL